MILKKRWFIALTAVLAILIATIPSVLSASLREGDRGADVSRVQTRLKNWGYYSGSVDGVFGPITRRAVRTFQSRNGLGVDGIVGPQTAKAIGISLSGGGSTTRATTGSSGSSGGSYTQSELNLLAKVVHAEARGEPYLGKVAVAAVVLNRVRSSGVPNTMTGVVYQKNAFTCVNDGQINLTPNASAISAAREALSGSDPSGGALYYYNPKIATSSWIFTRKVIKTIGNHRFAV